MMRMMKRLLFWRRGRKHPVVPAVRLQGVIGSRTFGMGLSLAGIERALEAAFADKRAPAVLLLINSPGGSPVQSSLIAGRIRRLAAEKRKPVIAIVEDVAASGGYWLATAADEIFADASSLVGSIGVISAGFGFTDAIARLGIERRVHTAGERKGLLDPFQPEQPRDLAMLRDLQGDIHEAFKNQVRERRGDRLRLPDEELFDGRVWTGQRGTEAGLIDGLATADELVRLRFGKKARIRTVGQRRSWLARRLRPGVEGLPGLVLAAVEERLAWQRFGL